jgi:hypothetical protein
VNSAHNVAALFVGVLRYGTAIYDTHVGILKVIGALVAVLDELASNGGGFRKVELAAQCVETNFHFTLFGG